MEIKSSEVSMEAKVVSESASDSDVFINKMVSRKKRKKEAKNEGDITYLHSYQAILHDKPLSLKGDGGFVQGKKYLMQGKQAYQPDMRDSFSTVLKASTKAAIPPSVIPATSVGGAVDVINRSVIMDKLQQSSASFSSQGDSKVSGKSDNVSVPEKSHAVDILPLGASAYSYRHTDEVTPHSRTSHSHHNGQMPTPFASVTQQERLNGLWLEKSGDDQTVRISYPFQRWLGEHSVKVSLRRENLHEGAMVLQPSDVRASDALSRQLEHWPKQTPEILRPDSMGDEQRERQQQREQEEDQ